MANIDKFRVDGTTYDFIDSTARTTANAAVPQTRTVNSKALSSDITLTSEDIGYDSSATYTDGTIGAGVSELKTALSVQKLEKLSDQLIPKKYIYYTGEIRDAASATDYEITDYVDVSGWSQVAITASCLSNRLYYAFYNSEKTYIANSGKPFVTGVTLNDEIVNVPNGAKYCVAMWYYQASTLYDPIIKGVSMRVNPDGFVEYNEGQNLTETQKATARSNIGISTDVLNGKKWCALGDSFTDYTNKLFETGRFLGESMSYPRLIAERNNMVLEQDFCVTGRTMAYPADGTFTNSATCPTDDGYYQNIPADVDYVTIMLGINDVNHLDDETGAITLGQITDTSTSTYYGAYNTVLTWLRANRPFAHVGIIVTNGTESEDFTNAQIALAEKYGYPYLNLNGDDRTPAFIRCYNTKIDSTIKNSLKTIQGVDAPTNTHPNWQTHELESTIIEAWLRTL